MDNYILSLKHAACLIPGTNSPLLKDISLNIKQGEHIIVLGDNGSGKSSLFKLITGEYQLSSGKITFANDERKPRIATLSQSTADNICLPLTVYENARLYLQSSKDTRLIELNKAAIGNFITQYHPGIKDKLDTPVGALSGGERQLLALVLCMLLQPDLLLLDEHTSALDPEKSKYVMQLTEHMIKEQGITCLMITHNLSHLAKDARIVNMLEGTLTDN